VVPAWAIHHCPLGDNAAPRMTLVPHFKHKGILVEHALAVHVHVPGPGPTCCVGLCALCCVRLHMAACKCVPSNLTVARHTAGWVGSGCVRGGVQLASPGCVPPAGTPSLHMQQTHVHENMTAPLWVLK
jgi:hypothetical protein